MTAQLMTAISNRDGDALARMAAGSTEPQRLLDFEAERLVDSLFRQLKQIFPASTQTNLRTDAGREDSEAPMDCSFCRKRDPHPRAVIRRSATCESQRIAVLAIAGPVHQVVQGQRHRAGSDSCRRDERVPPLQP
ncbi:Origin specific replication binding factor [Klebsiella pneumoniae]|uniref:Origin specific replication binding factor n=1 Tax=Klebsiella pneumoniae TaxID=573 RepID=A0A2X3CAU1_KLEPN|nr:Origin specific replication binding factor [Klebsiella pneumoniae]